MIATDLFESARANMASTYLSIASGAPDADIYRSSGWVGCRSSVPHSIANFAILLSQGDRNETCAQEFLADRPSACLYRISMASERSGPTNGSRCLKLLAAPAKPSKSEIELSLATSDWELGSVASFMVSQFFGTQSAHLNSLMAKAAARGETPLYWLHHAGRRVGAVMLNPNGGALGIYNFCIDGRSRGRGLGGETLAAISSLAYGAGLDLTLQCSPQIVPFYERNGFEIVGHVDIWLLDRAKSAVIMR